MEIYRICWAMRGSITIDQAWRLTNKERKLIGKIIKENVELTEKTHLPLL